jgi:hypothetical protein
LCAFYLVKQASGEASPGSSSRDRTLPVPGLLTLPENGSQLSLRSAISVLIWYYQFWMAVKPFLELQPELA